MNKLRRSISIITAVLTAVSSLSIPVVSYAESDNSASVIYRSSFSDYTKNGRPDGWVAPKYVVSGSSEIASPGSDATFVVEDDGNNALRLTNSADSRYNDIIPFNQVISSGKLKISFDMKFEAYNSNWLMLQLFNTSNPGKYLNGTLMNDYIGTDINDFRGHGYSLSCTTLMRVYFKESGGVEISKDGRWGESLKNNAVDKDLQYNNWHHFDLVVDVANSSQQVWVDGEKVTEEPFVLSQNKGYSFKGLGFLQTKGGGTSLYDNIVVSHYDTDDTVKILSDHLKTESDSANISLGFSEYLSKAPQNGDFVITDAYSGDEVDYTVEKADCRSAVLKIDAEVPAKLNIAFSSKSSLKGVISSKLSKEAVAAYTNHQSGGVTIPVLDSVSGVDYSGSSVAFDGESIVPIGTTSIDVKFSEPVSFESIGDKIYIENAENSDRVKVKFDKSADNKVISIKFDELMDAGADYKLVVSQDLASNASGSVTLPRNYEFEFTTSSDSGFGIFGEKVSVDSDNDKAIFEASVIKSDNNAYKGTLIICGYSSEVIGGVTYHKLEKVNLAKYDISDKSITSYETSIEGLENIEVIKCFINDIDTQKSLCILEKEL